MELIEIIHNFDSRVKDEFNPDFFIAASGYESRSIAVARKYNFPEASKVAILFKENKKNLSRHSNDLFFKSEGFNLIEFSAFNSPDFKLIFGDVLKHELKILIDITVMPSIWYHSFFNFIQQQRNFRKISIIVTYIPAIFHDPLKAGAKIELQQSPKIYPSDKAKNNNKQSALIMGLGVEKGLSNKVYEIIRPDITHLLYADPVFEKSYVENVLINNHQLISKMPIRNLHSYPLADTKNIYSKLIDLVMPLRMDKSVTIVPLGPKIFSLMAILIQLTYPDIELFYPQYKIKTLKDREPSDKIITLKLCFSVY